MFCDENCTCFLCRELSGCEERLENGKIVPDNFILSKSTANVFDLTKYTYFGMATETVQNADDDSSIPTIQEENKSEIKSDLPEIKHKSVIYIDENDENNNVSISNNANVVMNEKVDEYMSLDSLQDSNVVNVVFKNTFSFASQIVNDVYTPETWSDIDSDDFPLGMEADYFNRLYFERR